MDYHVLPALNALLNCCATIFLILGFQAIRRKEVQKHFNLMRLAFLFSGLFLISYVAYHTLRQLDEGVGHTVFPYQGILQYLYYAILIPHVLLAIVVLPFILVTFYRGWRTQKTKDKNAIEKHRKIAKKTFPIWLFVSVSGVIVYLMLYQLPKILG